MNRVEFDKMMNVLNYCIPEHDFIATHAHDHCSIWQATKSGRKSEACVGWEIWNSVRDALSADEFDSLPVQVFDSHIEFKTDSKQKSKKAA